MKITIPLLLGSFLGLSTAAVTCKPSNCPAPRACQSNTCGDCPTNKPYYSDGACVAECTKYIDADGKKCINSCPREKFVIDKRCVADCPDGYKEIPGRLYAPGSCDKCPEGWASTADHRKCECKHIIFGEKCVESCDDYHKVVTHRGAPSTCESCPQGQVATGQNHDQCGCAGDNTWYNPRSHACETCEAPEKASPDGCYCPKTLYVSPAGKCLETCEGEKTPKENKPTVCTPCKTGEKVVDNKCTCDGYYANDECKTCPPGQVPDGTSYGCKCPEENQWYDNGSCKTCDAPEKAGPDGCYCPNDLFISPERKCIETCDGKVTEQENHPKLCTPCKTGEDLIENECTCKGFYQGEECKECPVGQIPDGTSHGCKCPEENQWYDNGACKTCDAPEKAGPDGCYCPNDLFISLERKCQDTCDGEKTEQENHPTLCKPCKMGEELVDTKCTCKGYYEDEVCKECPTGQIPDGTSYGCKCANENEWYNTMSHTCDTCQPPYKASPTGCVCPAEAFTGPEGGNCIPACTGGVVSEPTTRGGPKICTPCREGETVVGNHCKCVGGVIVANVCKPCQENAIPSYDGTKCVCKVGFFTNGDKCLAKCEDGTKPVDGMCQPKCAKSTQKLCYGTCKNIKVDNDNCGSCDNKCTDGKMCVEGKCKLPVCEARVPALTTCDKKCVNLKEDAKNCGACKKVCPAGASCSDGYCKCPVDTIECDGKCKPIKDNCGWCGNKCSKGKTCATNSYGHATCQCPEGLDDCDGNCVNLKEDPKNCGKCYTKCTAPKKHLLARNADLWAVGSDSPEEVQSWLEARAPLGACVGGMCQQY